MFILPAAYNSNVLLPIQKIGFKRIKQTHKQKAAKATFCLINN